MTNIESGFAVGVSGKFDPDLIHPSWLFINEIEKREDEKDVKLDSFNSEFSIANVNYEILPRRIHVYSWKKEPKEILVRVSKIVKSFPESLIESLIFVRFMRKFDLDETKRTQIENRLAPSSNLGKFIEGSESDDPKHSVDFDSLSFQSKISISNGLLSKRVTIKQTTNKDQKKGLYFQLNYLYELEKDTLNEDYLILIENENNVILSEAEEIFSNILGE